MRAHSATTAAMSSMTWAICVRMTQSYVPEATFAAPFDVVAVHRESA